MTRVRSRRALGLADVTLDAAEELEARLGPGPWPPVFPSVAARRAAAAGLPDEEPAVLVVWRTVAALVQEATARRHAAQGEHEAAQTWHAAAIKAMASAQASRTWWLRTRHTVPDGPAPRRLPRITDGPGTVYHPLVGRVILP